MSEAAQVEVVNVDGVTVVRPGPGLTNIFEAQLDQISVISSLAASVSPPQLVVDLQHVRMIGSAFLGRMVAANKSLTARDGGRLALCNVSSFCATALSVSKLDTVIPVYPTLTDAVAALR